MEDIHANHVVALLVDQPEAGLYRGDVGTVIQVFNSTPDHPSGFIVEFVDELGNVQGQIYYRREPDCEAPISTCAGSVLTHN
nr:DUF4926 domain-containing protein [Pyrinomonadaceae bacterium]